MTALLRTGGAALVIAGVALGGATAPVDAEERAGFGTSASAAPIRIEIYEPAIPIPAEPQLELNVNFSRVEASSGPTARARASALWPGAPVGEGLKTIGDQLGLPAELTQGGYPLQTNAQFPGEQSAQSQEPLPGSVTRVRADEARTVAKAGFASNADVREPDGDGSGDGDDAPLVPGLPAVPGISDVPGVPLPGLTDGTGSINDLLGSMLGGGAGGGGDDAPANPLGALGVLVSSGGMSSVSTTDYAEQTVVAEARSVLHDITLLAGLVTIDQVEVIARTTANLDGADTSYQTRYTGLKLAGVPFGVTRDGVEAGGKATPIPGLPDNPAKALEELGISFELPRAQVTEEGAQGAVQAKGLKITIDMKPLRSKFPALPLDDLLGALPEEAAQLKSVLGALNTASPRFVIYLGNASSQATAVPPLDFGGSEPPPPTSSGGGDTGGGSTVVTSPPLPTVDLPVDTGALPPIVTTPVDQTAAPGLPELDTIPGALMVGGLAVAGMGGWWLRRLGALALGTAATCPQGLQSGIPDLRKM